MTESDKINGWTFEETVKTAENLMEVEQNMFKWDVLRHLRDFAETSREEIQQYRVLGTLEELRIAKEKQIPKEPNFGHNLSDNVSLFICKCGNKIKVHHDSGIFDNNDAPNYCKNCGQKLDWSDSD